MEDGFVIGNIVFDRREYSDMICREIIDIKNGMAILSGTDNLTPLAILIKVNDDDIHMFTKK